MSKDKVQEGKECMAKAAKYLEKSLLKWVPDYDSAADEYTKAATCFRVGKAYKESKECLLLASDNYLHNRSFFHAAKSLDQAIFMTKEIGDLNDILPLTLKACHFYKQHGSPDSAILLLSKSADLLQKSDPESSVTLLKEACNVCQIEDSFGQAIEYTHKAARLLVKLKKYEECEEELKRQFELVFEGGLSTNMGRVAVELFLLQLVKDDFVAAKKVLQTHAMQYCEQSEINMLNTMVNAYSDRDGELIKSMLNSAFIKHMDVEFAILAKSLAEKWTEEPTEQVTNIAENDDGEPVKHQSGFGGGLC